MVKKRQRLDQVLVDRGLVTSRSQAKSLVLLGKVKVNGQTVSKAGFAVDNKAVVELEPSKSRFVSRGGDKLEGALEAFGICVQNLIALDAGISTGGFCDCLLQQGARTVFGVDVGYGDVAWNLRQDPRVILLEKTNLRHLFSGSLPLENRAQQTLHGGIDIVTLDLSFISIIKVLDVVKKLLKPNGKLLALVKPQFELDKASVGKGGIVREVRLQLEAVERVAAAAGQFALEAVGVQPSSVRGAKGNQEYFLLCRSLFDSERKVC